MMMVGKGSATMLSKTNFMFSFVEYAYLVMLVSGQDKYSKCIMLHGCMKDVILVLA